MRFSLDYEIRIVLKWSENCVLTDIIIHAAVATQGDNLARPAIKRHKIVCTSSHFILR